MYLCLELVLNTTRIEPERLSEILPVFRVPRTSFNGHFVEEANQFMRSIGMGGSKALGRQQWPWRGDHRLPFSPTFLSPSSASRFACPLARVVFVEKRLSERQLFY